jgi:hypothetical protein
MSRPVALERLVIAVVPLLTVWGVWSYGLWDPWELDVAGTSGVGRLPNVVAGWLTCLLAFALLNQHVGRRAAIIVVAVIASTPLFLLNARLLIGDAPGMFAQAWVGVAAITAASRRQTAGRELATYVLLGLGIVLSTQLDGVLLGPLPPVLAVAAWRMLSGDTGQGGRVAHWLLPFIASILVLGVIRAVSFDGPEFDIWLGGGAVGGNPPTFDKAIELVFHGFAPWSAALPLAAIWALNPRTTRTPDTQAVAWVLLLWAAFAFVSWTLFASRYGTPPYLALVPLAGMVSIWLADVSTAPVARWTAAVVVALLTGLLIRDYALYPDSPLHVLAADGMSVPEVYNPRGAWSLLFSIAGALLCLTLVSHETIARPQPQNTVRWFRAQWGSGRGQRGWLLLATLLLGVCFSFGLMCFVLDLPIPSVAVRAGRVGFFTPFVVGALVFGLPWVGYGYGRLGRQRAFPALAGGLAVGAFVALSFQPTLSTHFSPKPVYDAYSELTDGRRDPLATYKLPPTAAQYYTNAPIQDITARADLIGFLRDGGQRWAVIRADDLPEVDRAYRQQTGDHLYVADARSARMLLIAADAIEGRPNQSFLESAVSKEAPKPQYPVGASFEDRIELVGYDLTLPGGDSVGAGQRFEVTWYWRALSKPPSGYEVFVHIDGDGLRLNGDHTPVGGRYPTKLWDEGDVIADTQELTVPANYGVGEYTIYVGFFSGSKRLEVKSGPADDGNRVNAGVLRVR